MDPPYAGSHISQQEREAAIQQILLYGRRSGALSPSPLPPSLPDYAAHRGNTSSSSSSFQSSGGPYHDAQRHPFHTRPQPWLPEAQTARMPPLSEPDKSAAANESAFFNPSEPPPPVSYPPRDYELQKRIDKMVEYAAKSGPEFEKIMKERQRYNPAYSFLFAGEGHDYYRYRLWINANPLRSGSFNPPPNPSLNNFNPSPNPSFSEFNPPSNPLLSGFNPSPSRFNSPWVPPLQNSMRPLTEDSTPLYAKQPSPQTYIEPAQPRTPNEPTKAFRGFSGPLPSEIVAELHTVLQNLTGSKDSIKGAKSWFVKRSLFAPTLAVAMRDRLLALDDVDRQLHVIFLVNDILFDSLKRRSIQDELDKEAIAFQPVLGCMLGAVYQCPVNQEANRARLRKILQFWVSHKIYSSDIIENLESEMLGQPSPQEKRSFSPTEDDRDGNPPSSRETDGDGDGDGVGDGEGDGDGDFNDDASDDQL